MAKVTGIGGVFFKSRDYEATRAWYRDNLGLDGDYGAALPFRDDSAEAYALLSPFKPDTDYLEPGTHDIMINLRVDDMDGMLAALKGKGVDIIDRVDESYGIFAWIIDPNGIKIELWQQLGPMPDG